MGLTDKGWRTVVLLAALSIFVLILQNPIPLLIITILLLMLGYDILAAFRSSRKVREDVSINPAELTVKMAAGKKETIKVNIDSTIKYDLQINPPSRWCSFEPDIVMDGTKKLSIQFTPSLAGEYSFTGLSVKTEGIFGLSTFNSSIHMRLWVTVYPRVLEAVVRAALFLTGYGRGGVGETPSTFIGGGWEYRGSREQIPGESLRYIDWKATARMGKLMMKEFYLDVGGMVHLAYDMRAAGPISRDELSATFLNMVLGIARNGLPCGLTVYDGDRVLVHLEGVNPLEYVTAALNYILDSDDTQVELMDELIDPRVRDEVKAVLNRLRDTRVQRFLKLELNILEDRFHKLYRLLGRLAGSPENPIRLILVSALLGDLTPLYDLSSVIMAQGGVVELVQPSQPWLDASSLEEAYQQFSRNRKVIESLTKRGVTISTSKGKSPMFERTLTIEKN